MKKLTLLLFVAILLTACQPVAPPEPTDVIPPTQPPPSHQDVANAWLEVLNKGDIDATLSYLDASATVTIIPPAEGDGIYTGHAEIRGWYESLMAGKGVTTLSDCKIDGETITCIDAYEDEGLKSMGVDFIEGTWEAVIRDGKIQSYTFTMSEESLAKFPPPPSTPVEAVAGSINDLVGVWWFSQSGILIEYKANGTYSVFSGSETIDTGTFSFDSGKVTYLTSTLFCSANPTATYEMYVTTQDGQPTWLRPQLVGTDLCGDRADSAKGKGKFHKP